MIFLQWTSTVNLCHRAYMSVVRLFCRSVLWLPLPRRVEAHLNTVLAIEIIYSVFEENVLRPKWAHVFGLVPLISLGPSFRNSSLERANISMQPNSVPSSGLTPDIVHTEWESRVANILKAELKRKGVTYGGLVEKLADIGVKENQANIANKLSRGKFSAVFLIQCLEAIGEREIRL